MTTDTRFRIVAFLTALAAFVAVYWIFQLYPLYTHTGSGPGTGAQYVFLLIPSAALSCLAALSAVALAIPVLVRDPASRSTVRWTTATVAALTTAVFCAFWIHAWMHQIGR
jgi:hypothetical protein